MASKQHPDGYWTEERITAIAQNYEYKSDFRINEPMAYNRARYLGILKKVTRGMKDKLKRHPRGYWTKCRCIKAVSKCKTLNEFRLKCKGAYGASKTNGWFEEITKTLPRHTGFSKEDQIRLKNFCDRLNERGIRFMLSNSATSFIKELYKDYDQKFFNANSSINSKATNRGGVKEILVRNYK